MHCVLRVAGMFGTIVVQLPVEGGHTGGTLSVRHGDQEVSDRYYFAMVKVNVCVA
jgi:hypothetical protein